ncbi:MAG: Wzt carbohydrate-binding domain-containing protein, partial [Cyclobacteriaceae bacterium]|nr:Wzt carbohydrate-binding domain-containing protein [Cyclobacteriaceae bacterium]
NIFLNGTILGMRRREVREKFDEIVDFSGVEKFIDTPIKHYSSGMKVRLAFSVAAHLEPEILLIDEVLAVGDAEFQKKCLGKMEDVTGAGRTVLFVSHNMASVSHLCSLGLFLESGNLKTNDSIGKVIERYLYDGKASNELLLSEREDRIGGEIFKFTDIKFFDQNSKNKVISLYSGMDLEIHLYYKSTETLRNIVIRIQVYNQKGHTIATFNNYHCDQPFKQISKKGFIVCSIPKLPFYDGNYTISLSCLRNLEVIDHIDNAIHINIEEGDYFGTGKLPLTKDGVLIENKWNLVKC